MKAKEPEKGILLCETHARQLARYPHPLPQGECGGRHISLCQAGNKILVNEYREAVLARTGKVGRRKKELT